MSCRDDIEQRAQRDEGFASLGDFICHYILSGYSMSDLVCHIQWRLRIFYSYQTYYTALRDEYKRARAKRKSLEKEVQRKLQRRVRESGFSRQSDYEWWRRKANLAGYVSIRKAISDMGRQKLTRREMSSRLNCSYRAFRLYYNKLRMEKGDSP